MTDLLEIALTAPTQYQARIAVRDCMLRELATDPGDLAEVIRKFEVRLWPCWRDLPEPPVRATELQAALWRLKGWGIDLPCSPKQCRRILARDTKPANVSLAVCKTRLMNSKQRANG
jgi:hypothetical protein